MREWSHSPKPPAQRTGFFVHLDNQKKLREARKLARKRYDAKRRDAMRDEYRFKHGIDVDAPVMTPQQASAVARAARLAKLKAAHARLEAAP